MFEERVTLWQAPLEDDAISQAEREAAEYVATITDATVLDLFQSYWLPEPPAHGREGFSLIRKSSLTPAEYLNAFFDTGDEHQRTGP